MYKGPLGVPLSATSAAVLGEFGSISIVVDNAAPCNGYGANGYGTSSCKGGNKAGSQKSDHVHITIRLLVYETEEYHSKFGVA